MHRASLLFFSLVVWVAVLSSPVAAQGIVPTAKNPNYAQMAQKAVDQGSIRVIVQMDVPEFEAVKAASIQFKAGMSDKDTIAQAAAADSAMANRIAATADHLLSRIGSHGLRVTQRYSAFPLVALNVTPEALNNLAQDPQVFYITEDRLERPALDNTVNIIGASDSWVSGYTGAGWYVAILDTGIRATHEFFSGKTIVEACYSADSHCPNSGTSMTGAGAAAHHPNTYYGWDHGTHVAGIAAGNNNPTLNGVAKDADIIAVQVFSRFDDSPSCTPYDDCVLAYSSDIIAGLNYVYSLRATYNIAAVNLSLGSGYNTTACDGSAYKTAIDQLRSAGIATVVATANSGYCDAIGSPACVSTAISVGATTDLDVMTSFSNYHTTLVDLFAPGSAIYASVGDSDSSYESWSGTSMATPHVTGAFALMRQADAASSVTVLLEALLDGGDTATGSTNCGNGGITLPMPRINVDNAIGVLTVVPDAPDGLSATAGDWNQVDLSWNDNSNNEQGFKIERKTGAGGTYSQIADVNVNTTTYSDSASMIEETAYYYRVRAYNGIGNSVYSAEANDTTLLASPSAVAATAASGTQVDLTWTDNSAAEANFTIDRRTSSTSFTLLATPGADTESYSDTSDLSPGTTYTYRIRCENGGNTSVYVQTSATTPAAGGGTGSGGGSSGGGCFLSTLVFQ